METFGIYMMHGNTPMFGDDNGGRVRRGAISTASTDPRRRSAPPRPPRPELNPWPKDMITTSIAEIASDDLDMYVDHYDFADAYYAMKPQDFSSDPKQQYPGSISPVSEEALSSAGSNSCQVSPSNSLNKSLLDGPVLRRRRFSFESSTSAPSCYSQSVNVRTRSGSITPGSEDLAMYADIAMSNPYSFQSEIEEMRPYASHTYTPESEPESEEESEEEYEEEPALYTSGVKTASTISLARPQSIVVPMSRYNSQDSQNNHKSHRAPPPSPDATEQQKTLDEAWEDVKRAVAPKLKIAIPPNADQASRLTPPTSAKEISPSSRVSTQHELPPSPPPPPVPTRNPRRTLGVEGCGVSRNKSDVTSACRVHRLSQSNSSPNISNSYKQRSDVPPVPDLPSEATQISLHPAWNMPIHVPAPLPTPAASDCTSRSSTHSAPSPISVRRASARFSYEHHRASRQNFVPQSPVSPPPPLLAASRNSMGQSTSSQLSDQSSPRSRGFHEPPPVAPPAARASTVRYPPTHMPAHKSNKSDSNFLSKAGIYAGCQPNGSSFTTEIWAGRDPPPPAKTTRSAILRSILPGESATRSSYLPPTRSQTQSVTSVPTTATTTTSRTASTHSSQRESVVAGTNGNHIVAPSNLTGPAEPFAPFRTIPLPAGTRTGSADDHLPRFSNNFSGFCKCAWRYQTAQTDKAFRLRTVTQKAQLSAATTTTTKTTTLSCKKCSYEGPLTVHPSGIHAALAAGPGYAATPDLARFADPTPHTAHGVVYRWSFLFKSHLASRATLRRDEVMTDYARDELEVLGCLFCCADGKGTVCFEGAKNLCGHIAKCHAMGATSGNRELGMRVGIVVGRRPDKDEAWDVILPGRRERDERTVKNWL